MSTVTETTARNVDLPNLLALLQQQADVRWDAVVPASSLSYQNGNLHVADGAVRITDEGVASADAVLAPTDVFDEHVSERLGIPRQYLRRLRETGQAVDLTRSAERYFGEVDFRQVGDPAFAASLIDANVNGWLQADPDRRFLVRGFRTDDPDSVGIARALLSNRYAPIDHLDVVTSAFKGVADAGVDPAGLQITGDLSERRLRLRVSAPEIQVLAPDLIGDYRSPFSGRSGSDLPVVFAGFVIGNSETGGGAYSVTPRITFLVCDNGATITKDVVREIHIGGRLDDGVVRYSEETQRKNLDLITAKTRDTVKTFLDADYVRSVLDGIREKYEIPVKDPQATIEKVAKKHLFSDEERESILDAFIKGGQVTAGGVFQAVTAAAQSVADPDRAAELEDVALDVLDTAAALATA